MTVRKRTASSTAHLLPTDLSDDGPIYSSPIAKRSKHHKKSNKVGDGWLWRPSRAKIPSPNTSPLPLRWEKPSPPKPKLTMKPPPPAQMEIEYTSATEPSSTVKSSSYTSHSDQEDDTTMTAGHTPGPGKSSAASVKDLKTVTKRLQSLDDRLGAYPKTLQKELASLKDSIHALEERTQRNEIRAAIRHDIIFDALKKISQDVNQVRSESLKRAAAEMATDDEGGEGSSTVLGSGEKISKRKIKVPKSPGKNQARKTMERCLNQYMDKMNNAVSVDEVKQTGSLCKQYAEDLIKTYI